MILASLTSSRLTAFVVKVLAVADKLVAVKRTGVCDAVEFLISRVQTHTGLFHEAGEVFHGAMMVSPFTSVQHPPHLLSATNAYIARVCVCVCRAMSSALILMPP